MFTTHPPQYPPPSVAPRILVAALNWGLGHASRCVPLIRALENMGAAVFLASDGSALQLLGTEFPHLPLLPLPSYHIRYQTDSMVRNIARQLPRIAYAVRAEHRATERLVRQHGIHGIVSDNRYGCFSRKVPSVLLTHQIHLRVPNAALQWTANQLLRRAFRPFDALWVPDEAGDSNLSSQLSHPPLRGFNTRYLGPLSRFGWRETSGGAHPMQRPIAVVLSGPEPQRTVLEQLLMEQALALPQSFVFVRGKTDKQEHHRVAENITVISYLASPELNDLLLSSEVVVCRSGYSSLMDLAVIGAKKVVLIPTPGQTEQEYLGERFAREGICVCQKQSEINLENALQAVENTQGFSGQTIDFQQFIPVLNTWLESLCPEGR